MILFDPQQLGLLIRQHREKAGLTQHGLADLAGVGKSLIFDLEHGRTSVRLDLLWRIFQILNLQLHVSGPFVDPAKSSNHATG